MIDIHTHILPNIDDGAKTIQESVEMCRIAYEDGIRHIIATPHCYEGLPNNNGKACADTIVKLVNQLNNEISFDLKVYPGSSVHLSHNMVDLLSEKKFFLSLNNTCYILLEIPSYIATFHKDL